MAFSVAATADCHTANTEPGDEETRTTDASGAIGFSGVSAYCTKVITRRPNSRAVGKVIVIAQANPALGVRSPLFVARAGDTGQADADEDARIVRRRLERWAEDLIRDDVAQCVTGVDVDHEDVIQLLSWDAVRLTAEIDAVALNGLQRCMDRAEFR